MTSRKLSGFLNVNFIRFCTQLAVGRRLFVSTRTHGVVPKLSQVCQCPVELATTRMTYCTKKSGMPCTVNDLVKAHRIVVFMKGNPDEPLCGFSNVVCRILKMHGIIDSTRANKDPNLFASYDVLESEELKSAVKAHADWPTFPQVYFDGEFIGGHDILLQMHISGKLKEELTRRGFNLDTERLDENCTRK